MGLLDSVAGMIGGQAGGAGGQAALVNALVGLLSQGGAGGAAGVGGLTDLISRFEQGGLGHVIGSWVSSGHNLPISADQLQAVLGSGNLGLIAQQLGLSHGEAAEQLSQVLPQVVDHLTPQGQLPAVDGLGDIGGLIGKLLTR